MRERDSKNAAARGTRGAIREADQRERPVRSALSVSFYRVDSVFGGGLTAARAGVPRRRTSVGILLRACISQVPAIVPKRDSAIIL